MNNISNQKLLSTSKKMYIMLWILLVVLILIAVIPWIAPASMVGSTLLGLYNLPYPKNFNFNFSLLSRGFGFLGSIVSLCPLLVGTVIMMKLSKNYAIGNVFSFSNAKSYRGLGIVYLLSALLLQPISQILFSLCVSFNNPVGKRFISFGLTLSNLTAIFFAITLIVIAQVMKLGQQISEEQELTV